MKIHFQRRRMALSLVLVCLMIGLFSVQSLTKAVAASGCSVTPTSSVSQVSGTPSATIGQIGVSPDIPDPTRSWEHADQVNALAYTKDGDLYIGGQGIPSYIWKGTTYKRSNVLAINASTGAPLAFAPVVDGSVLTMAFSCTQQALYIGGDFHHVDGVARNYAAKISLTTGKLLPWNPNPNGGVESIAFVPQLNELLVAGRFTAIGGASRTQVASVDQTYGKATTWAKLTLTGHDPVGQQVVRGMVVNHKGTEAVMFGNFNIVNGKAHRRIALLKLTSTSATLLPWQTDLTASNNNSNIGTDCSKEYGDPELGAAWSQDDKRFATAATGGAHAGSVCDALSIWNGLDTSNVHAKPLGINYTGGDTLSAVTFLNNNLLMASGHNRWANNPPRASVAVKPCSTVSPVNLNSGHAGYNCKGPTALDRPGIIEVSTNMITLSYQALPEAPATSWHCDRSKQLAMHNAMITTPQGVWLGTDGDTACGQAHNDLVLWP